MRERLSNRPAGNLLGVILTAGLGTRLRPLTPAVPKPLVPLLNRPLVSYALELMAAAGIAETVVVASPGDDATARRVVAEAPPGLSVSVAVQEEPRGPGDAVASVGEALDGRAVIVLAVDTVLHGLNARGLVEAFVQSDAAAGLLLDEVEDPRAFGVAILEHGRVVHLEEKPARPRSNLALVGVWMLGAEAVERVRTRPVVNAKGESDLTATVAALVDEGADVRGWTLDGEWLDSGTLEGLLHAQSRMLGEVRGTALDAPDSKIEGVVAAEGAVTVERSNLTGTVLLGDGARVLECALDDVVVGAGATLRGVRLSRSLVAAGATLVGGGYDRVVVTPTGEVAGPGAP